MQTINLPLIRRAGQFDAQSFNEADNAVDVIWTTGATVRRRDYTWDGVTEFDEELVVTPDAVRLGRLNSGAPFLDTHDTYSLDAVIGSVLPGTARIASGQGLARVRLTRAPERAGTVQNIVDGIIRNVSVGYRIYAVERTEVEGQVTLVRVTDWEPWEISAVPVGADPAAGIRAAAGDSFPCLVKGQVRQDARRASPVVHAIRMRMQQRLMSRPL
jgi:phage head maturation protease